MLWDRASFSFHAHFSADVNHMSYRHVWHVRGPALLSFFSCTQMKEWEKKEWKVLEKFPHNYCVFISFIVVIILCLYWIYFSISPFLSLILLISLLSQVVTDKKNRFTDWGKSGKEIHQTVENRELSPPAPGSRQTDLGFEAQLPRPPGCPGGGLQATWCPGTSLRS